MLIYKNVAQNILFLGYDETKTRLIEFLRKNDCTVKHNNDIVKDFSRYDLVISFGYQHIMRAETLVTAKRGVLNLHTSYLPFNRGSHPNFWSFYEGTPNGVSIHLVDEGIDTGPIVFQKLVKFDKIEKNFSQTYNRLIVEIENLFENNIQAILTNEFTLTHQEIGGTHHYIKDLPTDFAGWSADIETEIARLHSIASSDNTDS